MIELVLEFLGIDSALVWTSELMEKLLPVIIGISCVFALYLFICFFQFLFRLIKPKERL